jgi:hypothetical protein
MSPRPSTPLAPVGNASTKHRESTALEIVGNRHDLYRSVLTSVDLFVKTGQTCRCVLFNIDPRSPVRVVEAPRLKIESGELTIKTEQPSPALISGFGWGCGIAGMHRPTEPPPCRRAKIASFS